MVKILINIFFILALGLFVFQNVVFSQKSNSLLDKKIKINLSKTNLLHFVNKLAYEHGVPIGVELDIYYRQNDFKKMVVDKKGLTWNDKIEIKEGSLKAILNSFIKQNSNYDWTLRQGVINIFPIQERDPFLKKLLNVKVGTISQHKNFNKTLLIKTITNTNEFKILLDKKKVKVKNNNFLNQIHNRAEIVKQKFYVKDASVKEVLNKFVSDTPYKLWVVERVGKHRKYLSINL